MRRFLALLLLVVSTTVTGTPAAAQTDECQITEQVFGVSRFGDLIVQPYCEVFLAPRTLATFGPQTPQLFYGGQLSDATVVIYGIGADGALRWYRENGASGRLDPGVVVGSQFGDWRNYQHLQTAGSGDLSGMDAQGRLWRWVHLGWRDGTDTWDASGPEDAGTGCQGARPVFTGRDGPDRYVGVAAAIPAYVYCGHTGETRLASLLPADVEAVTMAAGPGVTYALNRADHRMTRMILDTGAAIPFWRADTVARAPFSAIFTGRSIVVGECPPPFKYEWQWTWYEDYL